MRWFGALLTFMMLIWSTYAHAIDTASRLGADIRVLVGTNGIGTAFGWRYLYHPNSNFAIGGAGYTGQMNGTPTYSYSFGGMTGILRVVFSPTISTELTMLAGGGGGQLADATYFGGTVLEGGLGIGIRLGKQVLFSPHASYVWMPSSTLGTAVSAGVRFEFITDHKPETKLPEPRGDVLRDDKKASALAD